MAIRRLKARIEIYVQMLFRFIIVNVGIVDNDGVDAVLRAFDACYCVEEAWRTIHAFKVTFVRFVHPHRVESLLSFCVGVEK